MDFAVSYAQHLKTETERINFLLATYERDSDGYEVETACRSAAETCAELCGLYNGISAELFGDDGYAWRGLSKQLIEECDEIKQTNEVSEEQMMMFKNMIAVNDSLIEDLNQWVEGRYEIRKLKDILYEYKKTVKSQIIQYDEKIAAEA